MAASLSLPSRYESVEARCRALLSCYQTVGRRWKRQNREEGIGRALLQLWENHPERVCDLSRPVAFDTSRLLYGVYSEYRQQDRFGIPFDPHVESMQPIDIATPEAILVAKEALREERRRRSLVSNRDRKRIKKIRARYAEEYGEVPDLDDPAALRAHLRGSR